MFTSTLPDKLSTAAFVGVLHHRHMDDMAQKKPYSDIFYQAIGSTALLPVICDSPKVIEKQVKKNGNTFSHYITLNGLRAKKDARHVYSLNAFYIDLDFHSASDPAKEVVKALQRLRSLIHKKKVLRPTIVTSTGRGLGLYYVLDNPIAVGSEKTKGLREWHSRLYKDLLDTFSSHFEGAVDHSVTNTDRLCRLPGTLNPNSGTVCRLFDDQPIFYSMSDLSACFSVKKDRKEVAKTYRAAKVVSYADVKEKGFLIHRSRCLDDMRDGFLRNGISEGWRENYLFWKYNTLVQLVDTKTAREQVEAIDQDYFSGDLAKELPKMFRTVDSVENCLGDTGYYVISDAALADVFGLTSLESQQYGFGCMNRTKAREKAKELTRERRERRRAIIEEALRDNPTMTRGSLLLLVNEHLKAEGLKTIGRDTLNDTVRKIAPTERMKSETAHMQRKTQPKAEKPQVVAQKPSAPTEKVVPEVKNFEGRKVVGFFGTEYSFSTNILDLRKLYSSHTDIVPAMALRFVERFITSLGLDQVVCEGKTFTWGKCLEGVKPFMDSIEPRYGYKVYIDFCKAILYLASYTDGYGVGNDLLSQESAAYSLWTLLSHGVPDIWLKVGFTDVPKRVFKSGIDWQPPEPKTLVSTTSVKAQEPLQRTTWKDEQLLKPYYMDDRLENMALGYLSPTCTEGLMDAYAWTLTPEELADVRAFMWSLSYTHPQTQTSIVRAFKDTCDLYGTVSFDILDQVVQKKLGQNLKGLRLPKYEVSEAQRKAFKKNAMRKDSFWNKLFANHSGQEQVAKKTFLALRKTLKDAATVSPVPEISASALLDELTWEVAYDDIMAAAKDGAVSETDLAVYLHECVTKRKSA